MAGVVVFFNQALRVFQNEVFAFHQTIRWQAALGLAHTHAAAGSRETHANLARGLNAVVQAATVGEQVKVVAAGGAAAEQQLGHRHLRAHVHHLGCKARPNRVQPAQPAKQLGVLHGGNTPGERLEHVVVGVDQARCHQVVPRVDGFVRLGQKLRRHICGRADIFDQPVADGDGCIPQLAALVVQRGDTGGILDQQFHGASLSPCRVSLLDSVAVNRP